MKVLMVNYSDWKVHEGGDSVTLQKTAAALRALGVEVAESHDPAPEATGFDVVHLFNLRRFGETAAQVDAVQRSGAPIVITPFYMALGLTEWAAIILHGILETSCSDDQRRNLFRAYRDRQITANLTNGTALTADSAIRPTPEQQELARSILARIDCLLPNSLLELDRLRKDVQAPDTPFAVIPLGADADSFLAADPGPFVQRYQLRDFVLQVGRLQAHKNQLGLAYALRDLDIPLVLAGKPLDSGYVELCRRHGPRNLTILPYLSLDELRGAYAAARVHVLANWTETCGLVSLEAALADCNLVCSTAGYELEFFRDQAYYCDPLDLASIRRAVEQALANYDRDAPRRQALRERIMRDYNWRRAAEMTLEIYRRVIDRRRGN